MIEIYKKNKKVIHIILFFIMIVCLLSNFLDKYDIEIIVKKDIVFTLIGATIVSAIIIAFLVLLDSDDEYDEW